MFRITVVAAVAAVCLAVVGSASASSSSVRCVYKLTKYQVYMKFSGIPTAAMCDIAGGSGGGALVKVYGSPSGAPRCAYGLAAGASFTVYARNASYGSIACRIFSQNAAANGYKRIF